MVLTVNLSNGFFFIYYGVCLVSKSRVVCYGPAICGLNTGSRQGRLDAQVGNLKYIKLFNREQIVYLHVVPTETTCRSCRRASLNTTLVKLFICVLCTSAFYGADLALGYAWCGSCFCA